MAWHSDGERPITPSTVYVPVGAPSTATLLCEIDSTQLGTVGFVAGQTRIVQAMYILGADTNVTWQVGVCASTALNSGVDEAYPKTASGQSGQFVLQHELKKDYRIRARLFSTGANAAAYIAVVPLE